MATIKSYTDISQSKKLAEILPIESTDMCYPKDAFECDYAKEPVCHYSGIGLAHPCWSLSALLGVIRKTIGYTLYGVNNVYMSCDLGDEPWKLETEVYDNEVDACVAIIKKLNELNLL